MAPEQAEDPHSVDSRADIYSFGATFYHALTGTPPFEGKTTFSILYKHKTEPLQSPSARNPELSDRVCEVIERCLAKSPSDRFPSFAEVPRNYARRRPSHRPGKCPTTQRGYATSRATSHAARPTSAARQRAESATSSRSSGFGEGKPKLRRAWRSSSGHSSISRAIGNSSSIRQAQALMSS